MAISIKIHEKNILVTGVLGFIGWNFLHYLDSKPEINLVVGLDKVSDISIKDLPRLNNIKYKFVQGHTKNTDLIFNILVGNSIDYLVDFAASSHVDKSIENPDIFLEDNINGKHGLLKACLKYQKECNPKFKLINISTDEVFGALNINDEPFSETSPYKPTNPYSASKAAGDHLADAYHKTFGLNVVTTHCCNNFGPWQDTSKMIPKIITNIFNNIDIPVYGKGEQIREWISVDDHNEAIYFLFANGECGEHYNIGGGLEIRNIDLVNDILVLLKKKYNIWSSSDIRFVEDRKAHDFRYAINYGKIQRLGWKNKHNFYNYLEKTIEWYLQKHQCK
jgi:dTDP-glucose 4,6-dehydratase